jgi:hypothetical protein
VETYNARVVAAVGELLAREVRPPKRGGYHPGAGAGAHYFGLMSRESSPPR